MSVELIDSNNIVTSLQPTDNLWLDRGGSFKRVAFSHVRDLYGRRIFNVKEFGAKGDGRAFGAVSVNNGSPTITAAGAGFSNADIGKVIEVFNYTTGVSFTTTIANVTNATTATLAAGANFTGASAIVWMGTDDTPAIQDTLEAIADHGSGVCLFPRSIYIANGPLITNIYGGASPNCQIVIPQINKLSTGGQPISIELLGETAPPLLETGLWDIQSYLWSRGTIIKSTLQGIGTRPSVFGVVGQVESYGAFNPTDLHVKNLWVRTKPGGSVGGFNFELSYNTCFKNIKVDTTVPGFLAQAPVSGGFQAVGIGTGLTNGGTFYRLENTLVSGFENGYLLGEHTTGNNVQAMCNTNAFLMEGGAHHLTDIQRMCSYWNKNIFVADGRAAGYANILASLSIEFRGAAGKWFDSVCGVVDPNNNLFGEVKYHSVSSAVGVDQTTFVKQGGANLKCTSIYDL